jgi:hypothetical protein
MVIDMWSALRWLVLRIAAIRWLFKLGGLAFLLPLALLLKTIGLPILMVLAVLAIPVLLILFLFGLPIFLVMIVGSMLMGLIGMVLSIGLAAVKIGLFVVLPIWLMWMLASKIWDWGKKKGPGDSSEPGSPPPGGGPTTGPTSDPMNGASEI